MMKYIAMLLIAVSVVPALALPSNDYLIEDSESIITIVIEVDETSSIIQDVL